MGGDGGSTATIRPLSVTASLGCLMETVAGEGKRVCLVRGLRMTSNKVWTLM